MFTLRRLRQPFTSIATPQNMKRFYKESTFSALQSPAHPLHKYLIKLDDKTMKTPYRHTLAVPSRALALLITSQFNRQDKYMKTGQMPMLALCRTAVDADIEGHLAQHLRSTIVEYLKTDTLNFYQDYYHNQYHQHALPLVQSFSQHFSLPITPSPSLIPPTLQLTPSFTTYLDSLTNWQLIGLQTMTIWLKSTITAWNIAHERVSVDEGQRAAMLEDQVQMKQNGVVEEKLMNANQVGLMVRCGLMMYRLGSRVD